VTVHRPLCRGMDEDASVPLNQQTMVVAVNPKGDAQSPPRDRYTSAEILCIRLRCALAGDRAADWCPSRQNGSDHPTVHFIALGQNPILQAPFETVRDGHRAIGLTDFRSGRPLEPGELAIEPIIQVDSVTDPLLLALARERKMGNCSAPPESYRLAARSS